MLRIAICCGGGFSSSALAQHLEQEVLEKGLKDEVSFEFIPFHHLEGRQDDVDIAMLCPHLEWNAKRKADLYHIPLYIIPPKLYGLMPAMDFLEDAREIMEIWKKNPKNLCCFEDEPQPLRIKRAVSHRRYLNGERPVFKVK